MMKRTQTCSIAGHINMQFHYLHFGTDILVHCTNTTVCQLLTSCFILPYRDNAPDRSQIMQNYLCHRAVLRSGGDPKQMSVSIAEFKLNQ